MAFGTDASNRMGSPQSIGATFYNKTIDQSLRFDENSTEYLDWTPSRASTDNKKYTISVWVKLAQDSADFRAIFSSKNAGSGTGQGHNTYAFNTDDTLVLYTENGGANPTSTKLYRDVSTWFHVVIRYDTTQVKDVDRVRVYINGERDNNYTGTFPALNSVMSSVNYNAQPQQIGKYVPGYTNYFNGYMAEFHMIDGQALGPEYFGENKNGVWIPKAYPDNGNTSHGINGYHLTFEGTGTGTTSQDTTAQTNIGDDQSGNGNNFAVYGLSSSDVLPDSPTNNFATLFPQQHFETTTDPVFSEGNLEVRVESGGMGNQSTHVSSSMQFDSGKWYAEFKANGSQSGNDAGIGVGIIEKNASHTTFNSSGNNYDKGYVYGGSGTINGSYNDKTVSWGDAYTDNDIIGVALDMDNGAVWFSKNGVWQGGATADEIANADTTNAAYATLKTYSDAYGFSVTGGQITAGRWFDYIANFGQDASFNNTVTGANGYSQLAGGEFKYQPPRGFFAPKQANFPDPVINPRNESIENSYFYTVLYEGNGGGQRVGQFLPLNEVKTVNNAIRFEDGDTPHLTRTPGSSGNTKAWTWSSWVKRGNLVDGTLFSADFNSVQIVFSTDRVYFEHLDASNNHYKVTTKKLRDTSVWYHIVCVWDTANGTAADRMRIYVDGERLTNFDSSSDPGSNLDSTFNTNIAHYIGYRINPAGLQFDGYMADVHFVDGQALDPTSFGQTDPSTEQWIPKTFTGNHGQNGFHLEFLNNEVGADSANTNSFTPVNLTTANTVIDTPTKNFMTLDPNTVGMTGTLSEGNLKVVTQSTGSDPNTQGTFGVRSGKWYWETYLNDTSVHYQIGITRYQMPGLADVGSGEHHVVARAGAGATRVDTADVETGLTALNAGDILGQALDMDNKTIQFYNNGVAFGSAVSFNGLFDGEDVTPYIVDAASSITVTAIYNFGQDSSFAGTISPAANTDGLGAEFKYTPPSGYKALNVDNLPAKGTKGIARRKTPVITWIKNRDSTDSHMLFDTLRGPTKVAHPDLATAETTEVNTLQKFLPGGFQIGNDVQVNTAGESYVAWNWCMHDNVVEEANSAISGSGFTDAKRLVDKKVGLSIVTYTASAGTGTIDHGLGQTPDLIIATDRGSGTNWFVWHKDLANAAAGTHIMNLDSAAAEFNPGINHLNDVAPTSSAFTFGGYMGAHADTNSNGQNKMLYAFKSVPGFSKFGYYTGNLNADGPFTPCGFKPGFLLLKNIANGAANWLIYDNKRDTYNQMQFPLFPSVSNAEYTSNLLHVDFLSDGFKIRNDTYGETNGSNQRHIFWAMAEAPSKYSNAR